MERSQWAKVGGYRMRTDLAYDSEGHMWVERLGGGRVRVGLDPLGLEINGTLAQLAMIPVGTEVQRGEPLGSLEAEKFVGPLRAPLSGVVAATNDTVVENPGLVEQDPFGCWLVELEVLPGSVEDAELVEGPSVPGWFAEQVQEYRDKGVLAE